MSPPSKNTRNAGSRHTIVAGGSPTGLALVNRSTTFMGSAPERPEPRLDHRLPASTARACGPGGGCDASGDDAGPSPRGRRYGHERRPGLVDSIANGATD